MKIIGIRVIRFPRPYGTLEDMPTPASYKIDRAEYIKRWREQNREKMREYCVNQNRKRKMARRKAA